MLRCEYGPNTIRLKRIDLYFVDVSFLSILYVVATYVLE